MITTYDCQQGSTEWHELRNGKYTGSNASKLIRYGATTYSLTQASDFKGNFYTKRGHVLEEEAIELYEAITHSLVARPGFVTNSRFSSSGYSPDGIDGNLLLEVKCFNKTKHRSITAGQIPIEILAQIHFGLLICGLRKAKLILYNPEFAKKDVDGLPNPDYNPKLALKVIDVKYNQNIQSNFKRILSKEKVMA